jgi:hypothetical protein
VRVLAKRSRSTATLIKANLAQLAVVLIASFAIALPAAADYFPVPTRVHIVQVSTGQALFAYDFPDYVVRTVQLKGAVPPWVLHPAGGDLYRIQQVTTGRFLDAHEIEAMNFQVVTRPFQSSDNTQLWRLVDQGGSFTIQQASNLRFLGAYDYGANQAVTGLEQLNPTTRWNQRWKIVYLR